MFRDLDGAELHVKRNFHSLGSIHPLEKQQISLWRNAKVNCEPRNGMIIQNPDAPWCGNIYLQNWWIFVVNVGIHIPAPWSIWEMIKPTQIRQTLEGIGSC
jgi:hypothetical protein